MFELDAENSGVFAFIRMFDYKKNPFYRRTAGAVAAVFHVSQACAALIGLICLFVLIALYARPDLREVGEAKVYALLHQRTVVVAEFEAEPQAHERATAINVLDLTEDQATIAYWLSKKYKVAPEPLGALVVEAYAQGERYQLDPKLIMAVMAIESRFNPFAQSAVGAQGLMQVMTKVHQDKYESFGGGFAAFDPASNLQVGARILKDCVSRFGGIQPGLQCYVGAANLPSDGGYSAKVLAEYERLQQAVKSERKVVPEALRQALRDRANDVTVAQSQPAKETLKVDRTAPAAEEQGAASLFGEHDLHKQTVVALLSQS